MVEGHQVHRVAHVVRKRLLGRSYRVTSPNQRCVEGAAQIDGKDLYKIEAIGKNLFYFFSSRGGGSRAGGGRGENNVNVMHVHFGMSGRFGIYDTPLAPLPTATTRVRFENDDLGVIAHLSAMTVGFGGLDLYEEKRKKLGEDPLREDAEFDALWKKCGEMGSRRGKMAIGQVLMDQSLMAGVGNIYRAEILYKSSIHPEMQASSLGRENFETVWNNSVDLLRRGFQTGSILTVEEAHKVIYKDKRRRYIYNQEHCMVCSSRIMSWEMKGRTCYACPVCQPLNSGEAPVGAKGTVLFASHCAPDKEEDGQPLPASKMLVKDLKSALSKMGLKNSGKKLDLVKRLDDARASLATTKAKEEEEAGFASIAAAAAEKQRAGEGANVEHVALDDTETMNMNKRKPPSKITDAFKRTKRIKKEKGNRSE